MAFYLGKAVLLPQLDLAGEIVLELEVAAALSNQRRETIVLVVCGDLCGRGDLVGREMRKDALGDIVI